MVFSSLLFLFGFLPLFFLFYFLTPGRSRNWTALLGSIVFYAWGAPQMTVVLLASSGADFLLARILDEKRDNQRVKRALLFVGISFNLGLLLYFKYANFFVSQCNDFLVLLGAKPLAWIEIALPIGISFFTFHKISYLVDVYRGVVTPAEDFAEYALYVTFFPQLIAGPIIRYHDIVGDLRHRSHKLSDAAIGISRFCAGLAKKVLIANPLGEVADRVFALPSESLSTSFAWLGILAYAFQIYFDFAGYSDMAIGLARIMGFHFLENFNRPYIAGTFTEFWRRWHISLSRWMRDYLYIPLGGNRVSPLRMYFNLWAVFLLSGLWHGAAWPFVIWGAYHGFFLALDKLFWARIAERLPRTFNIALTFFLVLIGWIFFRAESFEHAIIFCSRFLGLHQAGGESYLLWSDMIGHRAAFVFALAALLSFFPEGRLLNCMEQLFQLDKTRMLALFLRFSTSVCLLLLSVMSLANTKFNPFIYFRF